MPKPSRSRSDRRRPLISPSSSMTRTKTLVHRLITVPCLRRRNCDGRRSREREVRRDPVIGSPGSLRPTIAGLNRRTLACSLTSGCSPSRVRSPSSDPRCDRPPPDGRSSRGVGVAVCCGGMVYPGRCSRGAAWLQNGCGCNFCAIGVGQSRYPCREAIGRGRGSRGRHSRCVGGGLSRQTGVQALGFRFAHDLVEGFP
jgi:hypothetical protein